jgi:hypothetical protein
MRQSEHVLYITLIDFLIQLIFLGLVLSVIYSASQPSEEEVSNAKEVTAKIKQLTGISDLTEITDELTRLGPLKTAAQNNKLANEFNSLAAKVGGKDAAFKILTTEANKGSAPGKPYCLGGLKVATFDAYEDRLELRSPLTSEMGEILKQLNLSPEFVKKIPLKDFSKTFSQLRVIEKTCVYNVVLVEHSFDTRPRDAVNSTFRASSYQRQAVSQ